MKGYKMVQVITINPTRIKVANVEFTVSNKGIVRAIRANHSKEAIELARPAAKQWAADNIATHNTQAPVEGATGSEPQITRDSVLDKYNLDHRAEYISRVKLAVSNITSELFGEHIEAIATELEARSAKTLLSIISLRRELKKDFKVLPNAQVAEQSYIETVQGLTEDKKLRGKLYTLRAFIIRAALLRTLTDRELNTKKLTYRVQHVLEAIVHTIIKNNEREVTQAQVMHACAKYLTVELIITGDGHRIEADPWMIDELSAQLINELAELNAIDLRVSKDRIHLVALTKEMVQQLPKETWEEPAEYSAIANRKTILTSIPKATPRISQSSWYYRTLNYSDAVLKFINIQQSAKYRFKEDALEKLEEALITHTKNPNLMKEKYGIAMYKRFKEQIEASNANGGHYIAGLFDSVGRYYYAAEFGHFQTSSALRDLVTLDGMEDPVKYDMRNNVIQMYAIALKNKALAQFVGLVCEDDSREDLRALAAKLMNEALGVTVFNKENIKPLFMVWAYNGGKARLLEGVTSEELEFLTGRAIVKVKVPGFYELTNNRIKGDVIWNAWTEIMNELVPGVIALKAVFNQLIRHNPLTETRWVMKDGFIAQYTSAESVSQRLTWASSNGRQRQQLHHRKEIITNKKAAGLLPRGIHSCDAYFERELVRRGAELGILVVPNHDAFIFDKCYTDTMIDLAKQLLVDMMNEDMLTEIVSQLNTSGKTLGVRTADGTPISAEMLGEVLTAADILAGSPMATEEL